MFGIGSSELLVILVVALLVLGPKNLPQIARTLGKALGEFRKVSTDFQRTLNTEIAFEEASEKRKKEAEAKKLEEEKAQAEKISAEAPGAAAQNAEAAASPAAPAAESTASPASQDKSV